jgi:hypothetical protein
MGADLQILEKMDCILEFYEWKDTKLCEMGKLEMPLHYIENRLE